jgi:hypothetical protein
VSLKGERDELLAENEKIKQDMNLVVSSAGKVLLAEHAQMKAALEKIAYRMDGIDYSDDHDFNTARECLEGLK